MKKKTSLLFAIAATLFATVLSCTNEDEEIIPDPTITTGQASDVTFISASITSQVDIPAKLTDKLEVGLFMSNESNPIRSNSSVYLAQEINEGSFTITLSNLNPGSTYYYRSFIHNLTKEEYIYGKIMSFSTSIAQNVVVTGNFDSESHMVGGTINCMSLKDSFDDFGICYGTKSQPTVSDGKISGKELSQDGDFTFELLNIPFGKVYYRSYLTINGIDYYGDIKNFNGNTIATGDIDTDTYTVSSSLGFNNGYTNLTVGVCFSKYNQTPTTGDRATWTSTLDGDGFYKSVLKNIPWGKVYYRSFATVGGVTSYGEVRTFNKPMKIGQPVDLGLSVKWADINIGADYPEESGGYFAWGETEENGVYNPSAYKWCNTYISSLTKYCMNSNYGYEEFYDSKKTLDPEDDAANVHWGNGWRIPSKNELMELLTCQYQPDTINGITGIRVTGPNSNSIFLPLADFYYDSSLSPLGSLTNGTVVHGGMYWCNETYDNYCYYAYCTYSYAYDTTIDGVAVKESYLDWDWFPRYYGFPIRPVLGE